MSDPRTQAVAQTQRPTAITVVHSVIDGLETGQFVPGQRLIEAELCARFAVGRQIAREALQQLQARGVVEIAANRGASIVSLTRDQAADTLRVTEMLFGLAAQSAARRVANGAAVDRLVNAMQALRQLGPDMCPMDFATARRRFYSSVAAIAANDELSHLLRHVRVHVLRAQYGFFRLRARHVRELLEIGEEIVAGNADRAEALSRAHVRTIRQLVIEDEAGEES